MSSPGKVKFQLVHQETGQRYPVNGEVLIGRSNGDILFPDDEKLSSSHCRIFETPKGWGIHDVGSHNGTQIDGKLLKPKELYLLKVGATITLGQQVLKFIEATYTKRPALRRRRDLKPKRFDYASLFAGIVVLVAGAYLVQLTLKPAVKTPLSSQNRIVSPVELVENEFQKTLQLYEQLGKARAEGAIQDTQMAQAIKAEIIPKFISLQEKMKIIKGSSEFERRKILANQKLVSAMLGQMNAITAFVENQQPEQALLIKNFAGQIATATQELKQLDGSRKPASFNY